MEIRGMMNSQMDDIHDLVLSVLVPHSSYIHDVNDDHVRYWVPVDVVSALSWTVTALVVPTIVGVAVSIMSEKLRAWKSSADPDNREKELAKREEELKAMRISNEELVQLRSEVQSALKTLRLAADARTTDHEIISSVTQILIINGRPSQTAEQDSRRVLAECIRWLHDK